MKKVRPSERKRKLFEQSMQSDGKAIIEAWHQHCQETIIQETLEAEIADFLGRKWYEHRSAESQVAEHTVWHKRGKVINHFFPFPRMETMCTVIMKP